LRSEADNFPAENDLEIRYKGEKVTDLSQAYLLFSGKMKMCELPDSQPALCLAFDLYNVKLVDSYKSEQKNLRKVAVVTAKRKIEAMAFDMKKSFSAESPEESLKEKKQKEAKARMEVKEETNLQSRAVYTILHHLCMYMGGKGVAETAMTNYNEFCNKKKEKYQRKCPEKGC